MQLCSIQKHRDESGHEAPRYFPVFIKPLINCYNPARDATLDFIEIDDERCLSIPQLFSIRS